MTQAQHYDAIVIGSGQSGGPLATAMAGHGWKTAIIERQHVGGTCVNVGCTPTKTMVASAHVAHLARRAGDYGVDAGPVTVDMRAVRQRKRDMVEAFRSGSERSLTSSDGVDLLMGEASFTGENQISVHMRDGGQRTLTAERFFIDTGTRPVRLDIPGLDTTPYLDSTSIMELDTIPEHLVVIGGGYIGLEFGQMFRRFGSEVTILQRSAQLMSREDPDIAATIREILEEDGLKVMLQAQTRKVASDGAGGVKLTIETPDGDVTVTGSHLLVAAGRTPNSDSLNLAAAGVETDERGFITVNDKLETTAPGIWAMGEAAGQPAFTHVSYDDFRILRTNLLQGGRRTTSDRIIAYVAYIDPQLGCVGLSETEAKNQGLNVKIASMPMSRVARASETSQTRGLMKAIVDATDGKILGAAILGAEGGEIMSIIQTAMMGGLTYDVLRDGVYAHPTYAESLNNLFNTLE